VKNRSDLQQLLGIIICYALYLIFISAKQVVRKKLTVIISVTFNRQSHDLVV